GRQPALPDTCSPSIEAGHCGFELKAPHISCSQVADSDEQQLQHHVTGYVHMAAVARAENVGEKDCQSPNRVRLQNWGWRFLDDALAKKLQIIVIDDEYTDLSVLEIRSQIPGDDYFADPRLVQLLLKTNGGAR